MIGRDSETVKRPVALLLTIRFLKQPIEPLLGLICAALLNLQLLKYTILGYNIDIHQTKNVLVVA